MKTYDFDKIIDRRGTGAYKTDKLKDVFGKEDEIIFQIYGIKGYSTESDKTFVFQDGKLKACNVAEVQKGLDVTYLKRLEF